MNIIDRLKIKKWQVYPIQVCPICGGKLEPATEEDRKNLAEGMNSIAETIIASQLKNPIEIYRRAKKITLPIAAVWFVCLKEECPFNGVSFQ